MSIGIYANEEWMGSRMSEGKRWAACESQKKAQWAQDWRHMYWEENRVREEAEVSNENL